MELRKEILKEDQKVTQKSMFFKNKTKKQKILF